MTTKTASIYLLLFSTGTTMALQNQITTKLTRPIISKTIKVQNTRQIMLISETNPKKFLS